MKRSVVANDTVTGIPEADQQEPRRVGAKTGRFNLRALLQRHPEKTTADDLALGEVDREMPEDLPPAVDMVPPPTPAEETMSFEPIFESDGEAPEDVVLLADDTQLPAKPDGQIYEISNRRIQAIVLDTIRRWNAGEPIPIQPTNLPGPGVVPNWSGGVQVLGSMVTTFDGGELPIQFTVDADEARPAKHELVTDYEVPVDEDPIPVDASAADHVFEAVDDDTEPADSPPYNAELWARMGSMWDVWSDLQQHWTWPDVGHVPEHYTQEFQGKFLKDESADVKHRRFLAARVVIDALAYEHAEPVEASPNSLLGLALNLLTLTLADAQEVVSIVKKFDQRCVVR